MKVGDLVKYKPYPHRELQHLVGIVASFSNNRFGPGKLIWVLWNTDRPQGLSGSCLEEWSDELEVVNESR
jgi:hypothetical protein